MNAQAKGHQSMPVTLLLILCSVIVAAAGELLLKTAMNQFTAHQPAAPESVFQSLWRLVTTPALIVGFTCYGLGAIFWLIVLSRVDLSLAYPMFALMYVIVPIAAHFFLHEQLTPGKWVGMFVVVIGVIILARFG